MKSSKSPLVLGVAVAYAVISLAVSAQAQTFTKLSNFNYTDGDAPYFGSMIQDINGNLYGTTNAGGTNGHGTVFEITPSGKLTDLYNFCSQANVQMG